MAKIIKLTESDLEQIIKRVLKEDPQSLPDMENAPLGKVEAIQQALVDAGYDIGPTGVDGVFGRNTRNAVIKYQKANGVKQTGNVGPVTAGKLGVEALTSGKPSNKKPTTAPVTTKKPTTAPVTTKKPTTNSKSTTTTNTPIKNFDIKKLQYQDNLPKSDYLGKGGEFERGLYGGRSREDYVKVQQVLGKVSPAKKSSLPLHIRALMDYLAGRTTPMTAADLTKEEQEYLKNVAIKNAKTGLKYNTWKGIGAGNLPTAMTSTGSEKETEKFKTSAQGSLLNPGLAGVFMYTLGEVDPPAIKVAPDKKSVTVRDIYDFNSVGLPKDKVMQNFSDAFSNFFKGKGTFYSIVRNAVAFKELSGYPGYPVNITV
jgi:peptidoglycan hydrolase-like protein with peptidoglycan-binding domain